MKKWSITFIISVLLTGCSEKKMLRNAEEYLKDHIGDYKSYSRIEWKIMDTTFTNDLKNKIVLDSIKKGKEKVQRLESEQVQQSNDIYDLRLGIQSDKNAPSKETTRSDKFGKPIIKLHRYYFIPVSGEYYKYNSAEDLEVAIRDSINILQFIKKQHSTIDDNEKLSENLIQTKRSSPICKFQFNYIPPFQLRSTTQHKSN